MQRGLEPLLPAPAAIGLAAVVSLVASPTLYHAAAAMPTSLLLGWLAWRTGSLRPGLVLAAAHQVGMLLMVIVLFHTRVALRSQTPAVAIALLGGGALVLFVSLRALNARLPRRPAAVALAAPAPPS